MIAKDYLLSFFKHLDHQERGLEWQIILGSAHRSYHSSSHTSLIFLHHSSSRSSASLPLLCHFRVFAASHSHMIPSLFIWPLPCTPCTSLIFSHHSSSQYPASLPFLSPSHSHAIPSLFIASCSTQPAIQYHHMNTNNPK